MSKDTNKQSTCRNFPHGWSLCASDVSSLSGSCPNTLTASVEAAPFSYLHRVSGRSDVSSTQILSVLDFIYSTTQMTVLSLNWGWSSAWGHEWMCGGGRFLYRDQFVCRNALQMQRWAVCVHVGAGGNLCVQCSLEKEAIKTSIWHLLPSLFEKTHL